MCLEKDRRRRLRSDMGWSQDLEVERGLMGMHPACLRRGRRRLQRIEEISGGELVCVVGSLGVADGL